MTLSPGARLGPYEITAKLGEGGMGVVYRAKDFHLGREVALKVLPEGLTADPERAARFEREAKVLASLNHPHIAQIYGLEIQGDTRALIMELVEGPTLADRLERGPLRLDESLSLARQIAEALEEAHEKGIIHRDLKPQNIKITPDGRVKVLDFGLAKAMDPAGSAAGMSPHDLAHSPTVTFGGTREGIILGTAAYMAPEQARGGAVDRRADIWSFGVVLYEMLADERLFAEGSVVDTLSAVIRKPIDLGRLPRATPSALRVLLARCLERDPKRRLRDIGEARFALEALSAGATESVASPVEPTQSRLRSSSRLGAAAVAGALALGALLGAAITSWLRRPEVSEPIRIHPLTYSGSDSDPSASPDGKLVAFTSRRDGASRIWIRQLQGGGEQPLTSGPDGLARFSPDGSSLLFVRDIGAAQAVFRIALVGGEPRRLVDNATAADWSPDGRRIAFVRTRVAERPVAQLGTLDLATGREQVLADLGDRLLRSPRWSPDGRAIAFASGTFSAEDWTLQNVEVKSGLVSAIPPGKATSALGGIAWSGSGRTLFYVQSPGIMGDLIGSGSGVLSCDVASGARRTLFWSDGLSLLNSTVSEISQLDVLAPGRLVFGQRLRRQYLREVELGAPGNASASGRLATGSSIDRQPTYSPDGSKILFSSNRGGNLDLWTIDRASGALHQITDDPAPDWDPAYSPDGRQILWSSSRESGKLEIWIANADGSGARQVSRDGISAQNPVETRDSGWVVYWSGNPDKFGLWKVRPDGSGTTLLQRAANPALSDGSPDGRYAYWIEQDRSNLRNILRFVDVASGRLLPVTIEVQYTLGAPAITWGRARWSPDSRTIYFVGEDRQGLSGVYQQEFAPERDTTSTRRAVAGFSPEYVTESFGVSPDGTRLALSTGQETVSIQVADGVPGALPPIRREP